MGKNLENPMPMAVGTRQFWHSYIHTGQVCVKHPKQSFGVQDWLEKLTKWEL
jgi:hypothetical protein